MTADQAFDTGHYTPTEMEQAGYTPGQVEGVLIDQKAAGMTAEQAIEAGFTPAQMEAAGYTPGAGRRHPRWPEGGWHDGGAGG